MHMQFNNENTHKHTLNLLGNSHSTISTFYPTAWKDLGRNQNASKRQEEIETHSSRPMSPLGTKWINEVHVSIK